MRVIVTANYQELSMRAADLVQDLVASKPEAVLGLPTGNTPLGMYRELVRRVTAGQLDLSRVYAFALDDYLGLPPIDRRLFLSNLRDLFIEPAGLDAARIHVLPSDTSDPISACSAYEANIVAVGGLDLILLGIGLNGHLGFNEPGSPFDSRTRVVTLTEETLRGNAQYWGSGIEQVPRKGLTMGIATILEARQIVLLANGESKAEIVRKALEGPITPDVPSSVLQENQQAIVLLDEAAAARLVHTLA